MSDTYILDTNSFRVFSNYYPDNFPTFWDNIESLVDSGHLISCLEVSKELEKQNTSVHLSSWIQAHSGIFEMPSEDEMGFVARIFRVPHFRQLIGVKQQLRGLPVADPFLVARGAIINGCVVTEENMKPHAAKIPNVCKHFGVRSTNAHGFLSEVGWSF